VRNLIEGLGEAVVDGLGEVADQAAELAQRPLEVGALLGQLARTAALGLVLLGGQRIDGPKALAPALEPVCALRSPDDALRPGLSARAAGRAVLVLQAQA